jgi:acetyl-CoA carboxylase biotin carboxylase subunit
LPLHTALALDPDVVAGRFHTRFLEQWLEARFTAPAGVKEVV